MIPSLAEQLSPLKCGDHLCLICDTFEEQMAAIVPYVKAGLARGERCVYLAGEGASDQVLAALAGGGVDVRRETERGSFLMLSNPDVRLKGGRFDPQATTAFLRGALTEALSAGFSALRVTVDWTRGLGTDVVVDRIIEYEATLNASVFAPGSSMLGLCQYDRHRSPPEVIEGVLRTHPVAILGDLVCPNLYYEPPEVALGNTLASARMEWMITQLKRARKTSQDLGDTNALLGDHMAVQRESERSLGVLLSNLPGLAYRCRNDRDWTMEFVSQGCLALTGYQPADLVGNSRISFGQLIHPDDRQGVWDSVQATIENREPYQLTYRIITQSGEERWVWGHGCGIFSADGALVALEGFIRDITEHKRAGEALQEREERFRLVAANSPDTILHQDADLRYTWIASPALDAAELEESLGKTDLERFEWFNPQEARRLTEIKKGVLETGLRARTEATLQMGGMTRHFDSVYEPQRGPDGKVAGIFGYARDITDRKQAEDALKRSEESYRTLVETIDDGVHVKDLHGRFIVVNSAIERRFGLTKGEILGRTALELYSPEEASQVMAHDQQVMQTGTPLDAEETHRYPGDRAIRHVHLRKVPLRDKDGKVAGVVTVSRDITDRKQAEVALHKVNRALRTLSEFDQLLVRAPDETALLDNVCRIAVEFGGYRMAWVGIAQHDEAKTVKPVAWAGHEEGYLEHARISWADDEHGGGATGRAIRTGNVCIIKDVQQEPAASPWASEMARLGYTSSMALPLIGPGGTFGALNLYATDSNAFDEEEVRLLTELATDLAYGLSALRTENERRQAVDALRDTLQQLRRTIDGTIRAMAATSELRDPYTAGHQKRTARLAVAIAREMGLPEDEVDSIRMAGEIHDIGKISVPAEISSKPGRLSELEFSLIKGHAQTGYEILKGIEFPRPIAGMVLQHHERLDGSGYPFGLTAVDIIPGARILAVADVVEAMASHRPYRPARGLDDALREISQHRGTLYDPEVVDACLRVLADGSFNFE